jgi:SAM-dependent methyltransferase
MPMMRCRLCDVALNNSGLSLRGIPVCNRFTRAPEIAERHDLSMHQCGQCGLIQLGEALPTEAVRPRLPWIKYREPDGHLDAFVDRLLAEPAAGAATAFGVGPFDQPLLDRLGRHGLRALALDVRPPSDRDGGYPYLETWQLGLNADRLAGVASARGVADIICCRYLLEHCHDPLGALGALRQLLSAGGVLIIEVPDSEKFVAANDYAFIWEEHVCYFTEASLRLLAAKAGYEVVYLHRAPGELEDALVAVLRPARSAAHDDAGRPSSSTREAFQRYVANFAPGRNAVRTWAAEAAGPSGDGLALFGIGHQAVMFTHVMGLAERITTVVDDDPDKRGYVPPGFHVPIVPSEALLRDPRTRACLFAVAPRIERKVRERLAPLRERGVEFRSIFAGVPGSLISGAPSWH